MENKQKQLVVPQQDSSATKEDIYTWSTIRVAEGIAINVGSAILIAILTAIVTFIPSILLLLSQRVFNFLVIPTNWLEIIAFFGGAILFILLILVGLLYLSMRKHPTIFAMILLGAFVGMAIENKAFKFPSFSTSSQEQNNSTTAQAKT